MALQFQVVPLNFEGGVETKTDGKMVMPGKLTVLENGVFTKGKQISKRNGYDKLGEPVIGGASSIGPGEGVATFTPSSGVEELVEMANNRLYSYSPDQSKWVDKDDCYSLDLKYRSIYRNQDNVLNADAATNSNLDLYAWRNDTTGKIGCTVTDSNTGVQILLNEAVSSSTGRPRCVAIGNYLLLFYVNQINAAVFRQIDITSPQTLSAEITLGAADPSVPAMDAVVADGFVWVAYHSNTTEIEVVKINSSGTTVSQVTVAEPVTNSLTLRVNGNVFVYFHNSTDGFNYFVLNSSLGTVLAPTLIDANVADVFSPATAVDNSSTEQQVFYGLYPTGIGASNLSKAVLYKATVNTTGVSVATAVVIRSVRPAAKAFKVNGETYLWSLHQTNLQSTLFLLRSDGMCVAKSYYGRARGVGQQSLPSMVERSSSEFFHPQAIITKSIERDFGLDAKSGIGTVTVNFAYAQNYEERMLGGNLHITGGYLSIYDGRSVSESGFHLFPEFVTAQTATTGGNIDDGTYQYFVVYEWVDNTGQLHRSAPSIAVSAIVSGASGVGKVTLTIPTLRVTQKRGFRGEASIQIYRTLANQTTAYNLKDAAAAVLYNDTTVDSVTYEDIKNDTEITSNEILYTTGGVLENIAPESCSLIDVYQSRAVISGLEDPLEVGYSKVQVKGEGVAFSDVFKTRLDPLGGPISALRLMDDKAICFKPNMIFFFSGEGPNDTGASNNYTLPQLVTSDSGCPFPKSTVLMPLGIMYKSNKGIYLLNRALQVEFIGADVWEFNDQDITSAQLIQDKNQVRYLTSSGVTLMYDYFARQWSTFTNHEGVDATIWQGKYTYLRTAGQVYSESTGFLDDTTEIRLKAATAWLKMAGIQGYQRVRRIGFLGEYKSDHEMQVRVGYDYSESYDDTYIFDAAAVIASSANVYEFRAHLAKQKCASLRFEFQDIPGSPAGESYNMSDLSLEIGVKRGVNKLRAAQSV